MGAAGQFRWRVVFVSSSLRAASPAASRAAMQPSRFALITTQYSSLLQCTLLRTDDDSVHARAYTWKWRTQTAADFNDRWNPLATVANDDIEFNWAAVEQ